MSACDDLKEADNSLEKRKQMLVELERELREYNLKTFINTGFTEKGMLHDDIEIDVLDNFKVHNSLIAHTIVRW